jgi:hypothetical protein
VGKSSKNNLSVRTLAQITHYQYGLVAELMVQCRSTNLWARYDMPGWASTYDIATPEPDVANAAEQDEIGFVFDKYKRQWF